MGIALEVKNINKSYGGVYALQNVSAQFSSGSVTAIVGDNGAGKSTLLKVLCGTVPPDAGEILIDGKVFEFKSPNEARRAGIETVHQDLALANNLNVSENMFLGRESVSKLWPFNFLKKKEMESEAMRIISSLSVNIPSMRDAVDLLSGGQRQAIAIARATTWGNQVILMDEPTAALGVTETSRVEELISKLRSKELAVVIVSHNLRQVFRISDSVVVMRQGQVAAIRKTSETNGDEVIRLITGLN